MGYTTPITDRVLSDVTTPTSKGYFNVADWTRIYNNARLTSSLTFIQAGGTEAFTPITAPTTSTIPTLFISMFQTLTANIEQFRARMQAAALLTLPSIKTDWLAGAGNVAPNYQHVNQWESTIDAIWDYWSGDSLLVCPSLSANLTIPTGTTAIYVDCIDSNGHNIEVQGTGKLYII